MSARAIRIAAGTALLVLAGLGSANAQLTNLPPVSLPNSGSTVLALLRMFGALALVFALFFGGLWVWRNWQRLVARPGQSPKLAVLEAKSLGQRHTLYVVGYENQRMLVAASPTGVSMLAPLPAAEAIAPAEVPEVTPARPTQFAAFLLQALGRKT